MPELPNQRPVQRLDQRGVRCPLPIIALGRAAAGAKPGDEIELFADDPAAEYDVAAWCRMRGAELVSVDDVLGEPGVRAYLVRIGGSNTGGSESAGSSNLR